MVRATIASGVRARVRRLLPQPLVAVGTGTLALLALAASWNRTPIEYGEHEWLVAILLSACLALAVVAAYRFPLQISHHTKVYVSSVPIYLLVVLMPPPLAATSTLIGLIGGELSTRKQRGLYASDIATQIGRRVAIVVVGSTVAHLTGNSVLHGLALLGAGLILEVGDIVTFPLVMTPISGERPLRVIRATATEVYLVEGVQYLVGLLGALAVMHQFWMLALQAPPTALVYLAFRSNALAREAQQAAETAQQAARESEIRKGAVLEAAIDGILTLDAQGRVIELNRAAGAMFGYGTEDAVGRDVADLLRVSLPSGDMHDLLRPALDPSETGTTPPHGRPSELVARRRDGTSFPVELTVSRIPTGPALFTAYVRDISAEKKAKELLMHQALHDALTGLPNRTLLHDRLQHALQTMHRNRTLLSLLLLDLDHFKEINDTFGHHYGDALLKQLGARLASAVRSSDTVARLGGDEFAIILPATDRAGAMRVIQHVEAALHEPLTVAGCHLDIRASIGIALYPEHGEDGNTLLRHADVAMYTAKRARAGYRLYEAGLDLYTPNRLTLITELRHAVEQDHLILHYQPQVNLETGQTEHVEALVRWPHPERGLIPPDEFIPLAEEAGLMPALTRRVLERAIRQCQAWHGAGQDISVAVNLSAQDLHDPQLPETIDRMLRGCGLETSALQVEITESMLMTDPELGLTVLGHLTRMGVGICIDDFGTGYSSLAYLKRLPANEIKIDKSFVLDMVSDANDKAIVRSVIDLGHNLHLQVVAEGVENRETWDLLVALGCDLTQGYYVSHPLSAVDLQRWLRQRVA